MTTAAWMQTEAIRQNSRRASAEAKRRASKSKPASLFAQMVESIKKGEIKMA